MISATDPTPAEPAVVARNKAVVDQLPFSDREDFANAERGFIATVPDATILNAGGKVAWSLKPYYFIEDGLAPDSVNPSLWRIAQLNCRHGLFEVTDGVYQVRGLDLANMTIMEGESGIVVVDTLTCVEAARAALALYREHRGDRPVKAVIYTHTHADHFGGVKGVVDEADVLSGKVPLIAPNLFMEHVVSETVIAGPAMFRRGTYQFGPLLPTGPRGQVDAGLGKTTARGTLSLIAPTDLIMATGDRRTLDGLEFIFQMAPNSEAPAEMHMYVPARKVLNMAENATHLFHNLLPFRGAEVRDSLAWSGYINEAIELFGEAEVLVGQHHWPTWGRDRIRDYLAKQRDLYKYVHDQTLRLMNHGYTAPEIAEHIELPKALAQQWQNRDYYGAVRHNIKAIYQRYLGWYDANPANLDGLPPVDAARKYVEYMGGAAAALARAHEDFAKGEFRWVAEVANRIVFVDPQNREARKLCAAAFDQLGYLAEASTWRNAYLYGAHELRNGSAAPARAALAPDVASALSVGMFFDVLGVRLNGPKADGKKIVLNWEFSDTGERYVLNLDNSALTHVAGRKAKEADASLTLDRATMIEVMQQKMKMPEAVDAGHVRVDGNSAKLLELFELFDEFDMKFNIVEP
ncbi:alkyl/aryl-sulfatase [Bradyrhizobium mercantei]|uniref:alkyl/aryl-sulfatase n=1 Tax=Bradyrhizobium mercantei TaxID=1904807 RepID=UPI0009766243|nr:alkyl sulfatase dimerization domain-containing protein [Bradyrhizobium mercantei]